jgi:CHASE2 domain-containing sensor protein
VFYHLKVQQVEQVCLFELTWGKGQQLSVSVPYPPTLTTLYQEWQRVYLSFYRQALRGRVAENGSLAAPPVDWHDKLVQAEAKLLYEFHRWLRREELYEIRSRLAQGVGTNNHPITTTEVLLTCNPLDLARLPWEAWEIGAEFAATRKIRIVRSVATIRRTVISQNRRRHKRGRILVILGDDTGLNFHSDRQAVRSLAAIAEIKFVSREAKQSTDDLKEQIVETIADEQGWDVLLFAGHSNETALTGGALVIAPGVTLSLSELAPSLTIAIERGLQFALFNSCSGLSLANALIDLGLNQVAVMREPIHDRVAQEFLVRFLQSLGEYKDVCESLLAACQHLKLEQHLTYPSAYLIPSLFRHPDTPLFCLKPFGWQQKLKQWFPTRQEAIALGILALLSLLPPVQDFALERRIWLQAIYRHATHQIPATPPPVLLVQIDRTSLEKGKIDARKINPLDREYLAKLVTQLSAKNPKAIGLDYLLDSPTSEDSIFAKAVQQATEQNGTWLVFAALKKGTVEQGVTQSVASLSQTLQGYINAPPWNIPLLNANTDCTETCPFAYLLALTSSLQQESFTTEPPSPPNDLRTQVVADLNQGKATAELTQFLHQLRLLSITSISRNFEQLWLKPIVDFSLPPEQAYDRIAAWEVLENAAQMLPPEKLQPQVVLIAAGGYDQAGMNQYSSDNFDIPKAIAYWRSLNQTSPSPNVFTGGEIHAYTLHHLLTRRLVVPIPDLWMIGVMVILGKGTQIMLLERRFSKRQQLIAFVGATMLYALIGLQAYLSAAILIPLVLPSAIFWLYLLPSFNSRKNFYLNRGE